MPLRFSAIFSLLTAILVLQPIPARAGGDEIGNGGHVVTCLTFSGSLLYQSLDAYEAERLLHLPANLRESKTEFLTAALTLQRLTRLDPERSARYLKILDFIQHTHKFSLDVPLVDIHDDNSDPLPKHCRLQQAIIQFQKPTDLMTFFLISRPMWSALDHGNRAILLLHEVIYWDASRSYGHQDSKASRRFNAALFSNEIERMDAQTYQELLSSLRLDGNHQE